MWSPGKGTPSPPSQCGQADEAVGTASTASKKLNKSALKRMGKACVEKPTKCALRGTGVVVAAYTAYKFAENSQEQQACIADCLTGEGVSCESEECCQKECEKKHPTTLLGAGAEATTDLMDSMIVPFLEDFIGIPITQISKGIMVASRVVLALLVAYIVLKVYSFLAGVFGWKKGVSMSRMQPVNVNLLASAPTPMADTSSSRLDSLPQQRGGESE